MSKMKLGIIIFFVFMFGVMVGSSGKGSTTKSTDTKQSTTVTQEEPVKEDVQPKGKVEVKSHNKKVELGYNKIVGEVINNTQGSVEYVKVTATFYDKDDQVVSTGFTYAGDTSSTPLEAGLTTPFEVSSYPDKKPMDHYKLDVTWR